MKQKGSVPRKKERGGSLVPNVTVMSFCWQDDQDVFVGRRDGPRKYEQSHYSDM